MKQKQSGKPSSRCCSGAEFLPAVLVSLAACFMLGIFAPLQLYFSNQDSFWFDVYTLLPVCGLLFLAGFLLSLLVFFLLSRLHRRAFQAGLVLYTIAFLCTYVQGNFLVGNLPPLDGTAVDWSQYASGRTVTILLWVIAAAAVLLALRLLRFQRFSFVVKLVSVCMTLMLAVTLVTVAISQNGFARKMEMTVTTKDEFTLSSNRNFIILVLDAVDSASLNELFAQQPEYEDIFTDFTYYRNTVGAYPFTEHSIPFILSGEWYENQEPFTDYMNRVVRESALLGELEAQDYRLGLYEPELPVSDSSVYRFENILSSPGEVSSYSDFVRCELRLIGFQYAPHDLKRLCFFNMDDFAQLRRDPDEAETMTLSNLQFYQSLQDQGITVTDDNCFRFVHVEGSHVPFQYDEALHVIENGTYEDNIRACMTMTRAYLDALKASDVYDNSVILIMSDHGFNWGDPVGRQDPILFIKGVGESHPLQTSDAPISFEDLQNAYVQLLDGAAGTDVFPWQEGDSRDRRFLFYVYLEEDHMEEYLQTGQANDVSTMIPTGRSFNLSH